MDNFNTSSKNLNIISAQEAYSVFDKLEIKNSPYYFLSHWKTQKKFIYYKDLVLSAYDESSSHIILAGDPLILKKASDSTLLGFINELHLYARSINKSICGYCMSLDFFKTHSKNPKIVLKKLGTHLKLCPQTYDFDAPYAKESRRSLRIGLKNSYKVIKDTNHLNNSNSKLLKLTRNWKKSTLPFRFKYFLSHPTDSKELQNLELKFAVEKDNNYYAYLNLIPFFDNGAISYYIDSLVYDPKNETHSLSFLVAHVIQHLKEKQIKTLNFGFCPFSKIESKDIYSYLFRFIYKNKFFFSPSGLHYFKKKFGSQEEESEFYFFEENHSKSLALFNIFSTNLRF